MRSKLKIITLVFALLTIVLVPSCFAATVLEDTNDYEEGAIIYGSTRFDMDQIITAGVAFNAGINESKVWVALGNKLNELEPVTPYYYDGATWYQITSESAEEVANEDEIKKIEENLHIFFVNNEVKTVEVPFDGTVDEGSVTEGVKYDSNGKKFTVPAYVFDFEFTTGGAEIEVKTNVDTNIKEGNTEEEVKIPEIIDNNIASIGTVFYTDLYAAIEAAKAGETVKLLQDVELSKTIVVTKELKLDLNGKTIENKTEIWNTGTKSWSLISVRAGGKLTIDGNGTLKALKDDCHAIDVQEGGNVTIENGKYVGNISAVYAFKGTATINGGDYSIQQLSEFDDYRYTLNCFDENYKTGAAKIIVNGGTFTEFDPANNLAEGSETNFVVGEHKAVVSGNKYEVVSYDAENVTEEAELRALLQAGGTVKLASDIKLETNKTIGLEKDVILDLNGHTISVFEGYTKNNVIWTSAKLTVTGNGTIDARMTDSTYTYALYAWNGGNITIENGNFIGIYGLEDYVTSLIYCQGEGSLITILDGTFVGDDVFTLNVSDAHYKSGTAKIVVKGGTFTGFNPANNLAEGEGTNFVAEGYKVVKEVDAYKVLPYDANNVTDEAELRALIAQGGTITLGGDIDLTTAVEVTKKVTLDLNGKTLTAKTDTVGDGIFKVVTGGDLTINGEGTIDSACQTNDYSMAIWAKETGKVTINGGTFTNKGAKSVEDDGETANNNELIYARNNAQIVINGGTFIGNIDNEKYGARYTLNLKDAENSTASIIVKGGTFTGYDPANSKSENPTANLVADGYESKLGENDVYTVVKK